MNIDEVRARALECATRMAGEGLRDDRPEMRQQRVDWVLEAALRFERYIQSGETGTRR